MTSLRACGRRLGIAWALAVSAGGLAPARAQAPAHGHSHVHSHAHGHPQGHSQGHSEGPAMQAAPAASAPAGWPSAFDGYRRFADAPPADWRAANDTVGRIGGWRAYAREAQEGGPAAGHTHEGARR